MNKEDLFIQEKEESILNVLCEKKRITVKELATSFNMSESSIRRILNILKKKGSLIRTHGGAMSISEAYSEDSIETRRTSNLSEKKTIAQAARKYINDGDIIILGGGTTVLELAKQLHDLKNSIVITYSIITASELYKNANIEVCVCGGTIRPKTAGIIGPEAEKYLESVYAEKLFIGADAISSERGITTPNSLEAEVEKKAVKNGKTLFVLADHSKMDRNTLTSAVSLDEIDYIITDKNVNKDFMNKLKNAGINMVIA